MQSKTVGIDDMAVHIPALYVPIQTLAEARSIEYAKLNKGLGLREMSVADVDEDAATMAAHAILELIERNQLVPSEIGRIYLGTESALDGAKPTATYVQDMLQQYLAREYGADCLLHCDVVDLTFACVGGVDAMLNSLDWIRAGEQRKAIVVASDNAKYELASTGEYTQGAGAVAMLLTEAPRLLAIVPEVGTATRPVHDFFKPLRKISKRSLLEEALKEAGVPEGKWANILEKLNPEALEEKRHWDSNEDYFLIHRDTPVFDGPYSNDCYRSRIREALDHYEQQLTTSGEPTTDQWRRIIFHLPYAYQARRMFSEVFLAEAKKRGDLDLLLQEMEATEPRADQFDSEEVYEKAMNSFLRAVSKSQRYRNFVSEKIERGERYSSRMGNLYAGSIFLSLLSSLEADYAEGTDLTGATLGFFGYGSGSKSKVFAGRVQPRWKEVVGALDTGQRLENRQPIDYPLYEKLHRGRLQQPIAPDRLTFRLSEIHAERGIREGARTYAVQTPVGLEVK